MCKIFFDVVINDSWFIGVDVFCRWWCLIIDYVEIFYVSGCCLVESVRKIVVEVYVGCFNDNWVIGIDVWCWWLVFIVE